MLTSQLSLPFFSLAVPTRATGAGLGTVSIAIGSGPQPCNGPGTPLADSHRPFDPGHATLQQSAVAGRCAAA